VTQTSSTPQSSIGELTPQSPSQASKQGPTVFPPHYVVLGKSSNNIRLLARTRDLLLYHYSSAITFFFPPVLAYGIAVGLWVFLDVKVLMNFRKTGFAAGFYSHLLSACWGFFRM